MSDTVPLWKPSSSTSNQQCIENGHIQRTNSSYSNAGSTNGLSGNGAGSILTRNCLHLLKSINFRRCVVALVLLTVATIFYYVYYVDNSPFVG